MNTWNLVRIEKSFVVELLWKRKKTYLHKSYFYLKLDKLVRLQNCDLKLWYTKYKDKFPLFELNFVDQKHCYFYIS